MRVQMVGLTTAAEEEAGSYLFGGQPVFLQQVLLQVTVEAEQNVCLKSFYSPPAGRPSDPFQYRPCIHYITYTSV